ncbi:hypothetical protein [Methylorubrum suomiense]|uniref:Uncharacterized protein n=1 Tax=Methylorubrum suomiense TaxID=144191 RepID=A0ABQ4V0X4_9HYPH|nr:hypothetical protein [Methylorubrum suomiense]GJE78078.1 hypothetical protein BGCPKDLD_4689 [Methylorubrum suomiense]
MKQVELDDALRETLNKRAPDVDPTKISVFRAAALSTAPIRKKHPVYLGAVHTANFLSQMLEEVVKESRPLQIMHGSSDGDQLPIGRVFDGEISAGTGIDGADELLTLFWIDNTHPDLIAKVNSGTIDQVSVAILGKSAKSNKTGFDFMGPDAEFENVYGGVDDKGNKMGSDGAHVIVDELDKWFEMSLVGQGGAQGAKILGSGQLRLSASKQDVPPLVLQLSTGPAPAPTPPAPAPKKDTFDMDAKEFAALIADNAGKLALAESAKTAAETARDAEKARADALQVELDNLKGSDQAKKLTDAEAKVTDLTTKLEAATALPGKLLAPLFAMVGNATAQVETDEAKALTQVQTLGENLKALGSRLAGGLSLGSGAPRPTAGNGAFKRRA